MSNATDKLKKIKKNVINRYEWDKIKGNALVNDFLQLSHIAERLSESDEEAFTAFIPEGIERKGNKSVDC